jgi:HTH-type transcriptional regulator / antitoxin HigA
MNNTHNTSNRTIEIKPIKTKKDYQIALKQIEGLWDAPAKSKEASALEVLSILVDDYENVHYPIDAPDPIEAIKYRMEQLHLTQQDLAPYLGGKSRVSEVLNRKRPLTLKMIKALYLHLHIPAEALLAY